ncbi:MAG: DEAD/DEAH box helicase family protein, partial [Floccifex sp.]
MKLEKEIEKGLYSAFVNSSFESNYEYRPQFLTNDYKKGIKVLTTIEEELNHCDSFSISVAFITMSGIAGLLQTLRELEEKNVHGRILTTDYLMFSEPKALDKLASFKNIELKMYRTKYSQDGFHTKGYIFKEDEVYKIIIGSSNFTANALTKNKEWNTKLISGENGEFAQFINSEFDYLFNSDYSLSYEDFIEEYRIQYNVVQKQRKIAKQSQSPSVEQYNLKPNSMQVAFISNLQKIIDKNENRALLISATGTGKTYASAFAMRELDFKRVLFLVHRNQLAIQARNSFEKIFGNTRTMGLVGNGYREYDADYVFATRDTLSRDVHLFHYSPTDFDCIILDEAHHSSAQSYQKIMNYFRPAFWLGMTATPDKRESQGQSNIYEIFNYQIAYEIRLQQAMEEDLLCPFHYYGISDLKMIGDDRSVDFHQLVSDERVKHIIEQANYYGFSGNRVKGLIFCRNIKEADELSKKFNESGYCTLSLNGSHSEEQRKDAFERLAMDCESNGIKPLDYIFSVEILNEGVDIVEVNQVIMLRPTQSPIVFIQQLGRGLRKAKDKEYVVILDFIGNYNNNFMIPIALSGDHSYNKDNIRRYVLER